MTQLIYQNWSKGLTLCPTAHSLRPPRPCVVAHAEPPASSDSSSKESSQAPQGPSIKEIKLPKSGYFSLADPKAEIYSKATGGVMMRLIFIA